MSTASKGMTLYTVVGVTDLPRSIAFYDAVFKTIGVARDSSTDPGWAAWGPDYDGGVSFQISKPFNGLPQHSGNGNMIAFRAGSIDEVHEFHKAALANGGSDEGKPGTRSYYSPGFYAAYVRDPDGNKLACVFHAYAGPRVDVF